jgi:hypothetical protein
MLPPPIYSPVYRYLSDICIAGAAMSRTAVNSECGVKSPVNFLFTSGFVILTLYALAPALYWIPKATLSAIIVSYHPHIHLHVHIHCPPL